MAVFLQALYSTNVVYLAPFTCDTFNTTAATTCATAQSPDSGDAFLANFQSNAAAFDQFSLEFDLQCTQPANGVNAVSNRRATV